MDAGTKVDMARLVLRGRERSLLPEGSRWYWLMRLWVMGSDMICTFPDGPFYIYGMLKVRVD